MPPCNAVYQLGWWRMYQHARTGGQPKAGWPPGRAGMGLTGRMKLAGMCCGTSLMLVAAQEHAVGVQGCCQAQTAGRVRSW